jgi:hypothetical protein
MVLMTYAEYAPAAGALSPMKNLLNLFMDNFFVIFSLKKRLLTFPIAGETPSGTKTGTTSS